LRAELPSFSTLGPAALTDHVLPQSLILQQCPSSGSGVRSSVSSVDDLAGTNASPRHCGRSLRDSPRPLHSGVSADVAPCRRRRVFWAVLVRFATELLFVDEAADVSTAEARSRQAMAK